MLLNSSCCSQLSSSEGLSCMLCARPCKQLLWFAGMLCRTNALMLPACLPACLLFTMPGVPGVYITNLYTHWHSQPLYSLLLFTLCRRVWHQLMYTANCRRIGIHNLCVCLPAQIACLPAFCVLQACVARADVHCSRSWAVHQRLHYV